MKTIKIIAAAGIILTGLCLSSNMTFAQTSKRLEKLNQDRNKWLSEIRSKENEIRQYDQQFQSDGVTTGSGLIDKRGNLVRELEWARIGLRDTESKINDERNRIIEGKKRQQQEKQVEINIRKAMKQAERNAKIKERNARIREHNAQVKAENERIREEERLERERRAAEKKREQERVYNESFNESQIKSEQYYAPKRDHVNYLSSNEAIQGAADALDSRRTHHSLDYVKSASDKKLTKSKGIDRLKKSLESKETPPARSIEWPYESRYPITMTSPETSFAIDEDDYYDRLAESFREYNLKACTSWSDLKGDPLLTEKVLAGIQGSMIIANDGMLPQFVQTHENGVIEFGDENNTFYLSSDRNWFIQLKKEEHNLSEDNVARKFIDGEKIYSLEGSVNGPGTLKVSANTNEMSAKTDLSLKDLGLIKETEKQEEYTSLAPAKPEKVLGLSGGVKSSIVDNSSTYTAAKYWIKGNYIIGVQGKVSGGGKIDASAMGELGIVDMDATGFSSISKADIKFSAGLEALSGEARVIINRVKEYDEGYSVSSMQLGGGASVGYVAKMKFSKKEIEGGAGPFSLKAVLSCKENFIWKPKRN